MSTIVGAIAEAVGEQAKATQEIATSISHEIAGVGVASSDLAESSKKVKSSAGSLQNLAAELKAIVKQFKI